jgi:hypothetical protein
MTAGAGVGERSLDFHAAATLAAEVLVVAPDPRVLAVASFVLAFHERGRVHHGDRSEQSLCQRRGALD